MYALTASGPGVKTNVIAPDYMGSFVVVDATVFFKSPNGTLLKLDTTSPGASPTTVGSLAATSTSLLSDGTSLYDLSSAPMSSTPYGKCVQLTRVDPSSGAQTTMVLGVDDGVFELRSVGRARGLPGQLHLLARRPRASPSVALTAPR